MAPIQAEVIVRAGAAQPLRYLVTPGQYLIGQDPGCDIPLPSDVRGTTTQARLTIHADSFSIEDLGAADGVFIDGQHTRGTVALQPTQNLKLGGSTVEIRFVPAETLATADAPTVISAPAEGAPTEANPPRETFKPRNYEIGKMVARGGMGAILQVKDLNIGRPVAMKVMLSGTESSPEGVQRFIHEAKVNGQLEHPNIVPVHELGEDDQGQPFYTMKFVNGITLQDILKKIKEGDKVTLLKYPLTHLLTIFQKVCDAVAYANSKGIVHRDLKPANIMVGNFGEVLVMDWGLAKSVSQKEKASSLLNRRAMAIKKEPAQQVQESDASQTMDGMILGTPNFMAPEQAEGKIDEIDARTDIYTLGGILYNLLSLETPIRSQAVTVMIEAITRGDIRPLSSFNPSSKGHSGDTNTLHHLTDGTIPESLAAVAMKALAVKPENRYQSVKELQADIEAYQGGFATGAEQAGVYKQLTLLLKRHKKETTLVAVGLAILITVVSGFIIRVRAERDRALSSEQLAQAKSEESRKQRDLAMASEREAREARKQEQLARADAEKKSEESRQQRDLAMASEKKAVVATQLEQVARTDAEKKSEESRLRLVRLNVASGTRLMNDGDLLGSLPWFAEALRLDRGDPVREEINRTRLGAVLDQCPRPIQVWFHARPVKFTSYSPDGRSVVTASEDKTARVWDARSGQPITPFLKHEDIVFYAAFSPDGGAVVTASKDKTARVWDSKTGQPVCPPLKHEGAVFQAAFSPDGGEIATAGDDGVANVWDRANGKLKLTLKHAKGVHYVQFSPDGKLIATASQDGAARLWDRATGLQVGIPLQHRDAVEHVLFSPDSRRVLTTSWDATAKLWDATTSQLLFTFKHQELVWDASFSPDGKRIVTASYDRTARVWDAATGQQVGEPLVHQGAVWSAFFSPDSRLILTAGHDATARVWDATTGRPAMAPLKHSQALLRATFSPEGRYILTACENSTATLWDTATAHASVTSVKHGDVVCSAEFKSIGRYVLTASRDTTAQLWETATGKQVGPPLKHARELTYATVAPLGLLAVTTSLDKTAKLWNVGKGESLVPALPHENTVLHAAFSRDAKRVVTSSADKTARVWDTATGRALTPPLKHQGIVHHAAFSPDGKNVVTASEDGSAQIWDAATGQPVGPPLRHLSTVYWAQFNGDGTQVITASQDGSAQLWDARSGKPLLAPFKHGDVVWSAVFSPNGRAVVSASNDATARVWDVNSGELLIPPLRHSGSVRSAEFSPDGKYILTASHDGSARLWDASTGEAVSPALRHDASVDSAHFSSDGRQIVTASADHTCGIWRIAQETRPIEELTMLSEVFSGTRIHPTIGLVPLDASRYNTQWQQLRSKNGDIFRASPQQEDTWKADHPVEKR